MSAVLEDLPPAVRAAWADAPALVARLLAARLLEAGLLYQREVVERTPAGVGAGGGLRGSIQTGTPRRDTGDGLRLTVTVGTPLAYAVPVELGSKPHMPPVAPLTLWVAQVLGIAGERGAGVARAIAWKIRRRGTTGHRMFEGALAATDGQIRQTLALVGEDVAAALAAGRGAT